MEIPTDDRPFDVHLLHDGFLEMLAKATEPGFSGTASMAIDVKDGVIFGLKCNVTKQQP